MREKRLSKAFSAEDTFFTSTYDTDMMMLLLCDHMMTDDQTGRGVSIIVKARVFHGTFGLVC